jgi:hypothetical protein
MNKQPTSPASTVRVIAVEHLFEEEDVLFCGPERTPQQPRVICDEIVGRYGVVETLTSIMVALGLRYDFASLRAARVVITETEAAGAVTYAVTISDVVRAG